MRKLSCTLLLIGMMVPRHCDKLDAQKLPPSIEQCESELALWASDELMTGYENAETEWIEKHIPNTTPVNKLPVTEILKREHFLEECAAMTRYRSDYMKGSDFYNDIYTGRVLSFVVRHKLMDQFKKEDLAGLR